MDDAAAPPAAADTRRTLMVVILNYNGLPDTLACLDSLERQTARPDATVVIDNASRNDDLRQLAARFPAVEVIALPENLGWAGGNNVGLRLALDRGFAHVCLLNNDTVLDPTAIAELLSAAAAHGQPCLLQPAIAFFDEPTRWQLNPLPDLPLHDGPALAEMGYAYGACLLLPAEAVRRIGLLDERFFLQLEEIDYFHRARAAGIGSFCARRARILHKESVSFGGRVTDTKTYYQVRNTLLLAEKHMSTPRGLFVAGRGLLWSLRRQAEIGNDRAAGWLRLGGWLLSADPLARATRQGLRDYGLRRFGRRRD